MVTLKKLEFKQTEHLTVDAVNPVPDGWASPTLDQLEFMKYSEGKSSKWGVSLEGNEDDLYNLIVKVQGRSNSDANVYFTKFEDVYILRFDAWNDSNDAQEVILRAKNVVDRLCGALRYTDASAEIELAIVFEFNGEEVVNQTRNNRAQITMRVHPVDYASPEKFWQIVGVCEREKYLHESIAAP